MGWEWATFSRAEAIHNLITSKKSDIIHALSHDTMLAACIAVKALSIPNKPYIVATTSEMSTEDSEFGISRSRFVYQLPIDGLIQLSKYYMDVAVKHRCNPKERCIAAAVDLELFSSGNRQQGRKLLDINENKFLITCPSRFSKRKGQHDLTAALKLLPNNLKKNLVCLFAGGTNSASNQYLVKIKKQVESSGVTCLFKSIIRDKMPHIFKATDLVVMPSYKEGLGFSAIESMVAGCPVLLNRVEGFIEIPDNPNEVVFTTRGDIKELSNEIKRLMTDHNFRKNIANAGQKMAKKKFSPQNLSSKILQLYSKLIKGSI